MVHRRTVSWEPVLHSSSCSCGRLLNRVQTASSDTLPSLGLKDNARRLVQQWTSDRVPTSDLPQSMSKIARCSKLAPQLWAMCGKVASPETESTSPGNRVSFIVPQCYMYLCAARPNSSSGAICGKLNNPSRRSAWVFCHRNV